MNTKEYDQKKWECWEEYFKHVVCGTDSHEYWFNKIFDCAFALGKEKEPITQEEIEKVAQERADNILKDGFREHNRLHIAAMAMQGILNNIDLFKKVLETGKETLDGHGIPYRAVAKASFLFADALIAESEKGGES